jgi:hypothetical protein
MNTTMTMLTAAGVLCAVALGSAQTGRPAVLAQVDHLVYTTPDLKAGIDAIEKLLGVRATPGGQHPGYGTRNALVALGPETYLEIIGPDPDQPTPDGPRRFGIDSLKSPRLFTWVAKGTDLDQLTAKAARHSVNLGAVIAGRRQRPDGVLLTWRYTDPNIVVGDRLVPYVIDWGTSPHPALTAAAGATLVGLRAEHPDAARIQTMLRLLDLELEVSVGPRPSLIATIVGTKGRVELRN